jgi:hypothetical protein
MAEITDIAAALVTALNAQSWPVTFQAERAYQPTFELKDLKTLKVTVVPKGVMITQVTREKASHDYQVDVGVQKKFQKGDAAELDPLMELVQQIANLFRGQRLNGMLAAMWIKSEINPLYSLEHMEQYRQFTSVVTFTFRVVR